MTLNVKAGQVIYLKQETEMDVVIARTSLKALSDLEGRCLTKDASLGTIAKESE